MAEVHVLPGVERRDLLDVQPPEAFFQSIIEDGITDAVVVGRDRGGDLYVRSCGKDVDCTVGMLMRAVHYLTAMRLDNDQVIETEPPEPA